MKRRLFFSYVMLWIYVSGFSQQYRVGEIIDIGNVPSSFPVGFALLTHGQQQFVAYYDAEKNMTVASRQIGSGNWQYKVLDNKIGWDSHNYIRMKIDDKGYLHVTGNMHVVPMIYYISTRPLDIQSLTRITKMVDAREDSVTYPEFMDGPRGEFLFHYRYGRSGNGYEVYNIWDASKMEWKRYLDKPLTDGNGARNAYMEGPVPGPDKYFHLIWVWRETPDVATNHTLSYARSKDLLHWENIAGKPIRLPITLGDSSLYVDDTPPGGGLINGGMSLGFDANGQVLIGYHKYDKNGNTQLYIARYENGLWKRKQITNWDFHWHFQGGGSIIRALAVADLVALPNGQLSFSYQREGSASGQIILDGKTLDSLNTRPRPDLFPKDLRKPATDFPRMAVMIAHDAGKTTTKTTKYLLRWETLPANRDVKPTGLLPPPTKLQLYKLIRN